MAVRSPETRAESEQAGDRDPRSGRPAVFLDRDGTLNREVQGALSRPEQLELLPGAGRAVRALRAAGFAVCVVTNQSAIARGWLDPEQLGRVHAALAAALRADGAEGAAGAAGAELDLVLHCPHHPSEGEPPYRRVCRCRKPGAGMLLDAAERLDLDLARSWIVGDAARDLEAGAAVGVRGILVGTGKGAAERARLAGEGRAPEFFAQDLPAAVDRILSMR